MAFSRWGATPGSAGILFLIALDNMIDFRRRKLRGCVEWALSALAGPGSRARIFLRARARGSTSGVPFALRVGGGDVQGVWECLGGHYENAEVDRLIQRERIRYIVDGGANIGSFSVSRLISFVIDGLLAIEPQSENFSLLSENLSRFPTARVVRAALGNRDGDGWLKFCGSLNNELVDPASERKEGGETVEVRRIVSLISVQWPMDATWLKLDVEGAEYACLSDLFGAKLYPAVISCEFHPPWEGRLPEVLSRMEAAGYRIDSDLGHVGPDDCVHLTAVRKVRQ